jgi:hypothetical protein
MTPGHAVLPTLIELLGRTVELDGTTPPSGDARLSADLGLTSIDFVAFAEAVELHYGRQLPFAELLNALAAREEWDVTLATLADFVTGHLGPDPPPDDAGSPPGRS